MSQPDSRFVPNLTLLRIQARAEREGYYAAVRALLDLPDADLETIKERAHSYYVHGPGSFCDEFLLVRAWIKGFEYALALAGHSCHFNFEIDLWIKDPPSLPKKTDNPK